MVGRGRRTVWKAPPEVGFLKIVSPSLHGHLPYMVGRDRRIESPIEQVRDAKASHLSHGHLPYMVGETDGQFKALPEVRDAKRFSPREYRHVLLDQRAPRARPRVPSAKSVTIDLHLHYMKKCPYSTPPTKTYRSLHGHLPYIGTIK